MLDCHLIVRTWPFAVHTCHALPCALPVAALFLLANCEHTSSPSPEPSTPSTLVRIAQSSRQRKLRKMLRRREILTRTRQVSCRLENWRLVMNTSLNTSSTGVSMRITQMGLINQPNVSDGMLAEKPCPDGCEGALSLHKHSPLSLKVKALSLCLTLKNILAFSIWCDPSRSSLVFLLGFNPGPYPTTCPSA